MGVPWKYKELDRHCQSERNLSWLTGRIFQPVQMAIKIFIWSTDGALGPKCGANNDKVPKFVVSSFSSLTLKHVRLRFDRMTDSRSRARQKV